MRLSESPASPERIFNGVRPPVRVSCGKWGGPSRQHKTASRTYIRESERRTQIDVLVNLVLYDAMQSWESEETFVEPTVEMSKITSTLYIQCNTIEWCADFENFK